MNQLEFNKNQLQMDYFSDSYRKFEEDFLSAFWTIKGIILQNSVLPNFITGFAPTNRTQYPFAFHHN